MAHESIGAIIRSVIDETSGSSPLRTSQLA